jgi:hypothetical protein
MSKYTPAPWHYQEKSDAYTHIVRDADNRYVCGCSQDSSGNAEANARLVAAAPDLLEAAKKLIEGAESEGWDRTRGTDEPRTGISELRAAIAKAECRA